MENEIFEVESCKIFFRDFPMVILNVIIHRHKMKVKYLKEIGYEDLLCILDIMGH